MNAASKVVALDYRPVVLHSAGIGRYARGLVRGLSSLGEEELSGFRFVLFTLFFKRFRQELEGAFVPGSSRFELRARRIPGKMIRLAGKRGRYFLEPMLGRVDAFHYTDYLLPPFSGPELITTIHDAAFLHPESWLPERHRDWMVRWSDESARSSRLVLTVSNASRDDLIDRLSVDRDKIRVVPLAADETFFSCENPGRIEEVLRRVGVVSEYVLYVGTLEPRKNLSRLLRAFARLRQRGRREVLVLAGGRGWRNEEFDEVLSSLSLRPGVDVILPGYFPEEDLPALYQGAKLFVYPSLWEGFGLPVLEAFASGVPVITSSVSSLPEVAGDAAQLVHPEDEDALFDSMERLLEDGKERDRLSSAGKKRARTFSWKETARKTLSVYREALDL